MNAHLQSIIQIVSFLFGSEIKHELTVDQHIFNLGSEVAFDARWLGS